MSIYQENTFPRTISLLKERMDAEWDKYTEVLNSLTSEKQFILEDQNKWSIKDHIAHLTGWEKFLLRRMFKGYSAHAALEVDQSKTDDPDINVLNHIQYLRYRNLPLDVVLENSKKIHNNLYDKVMEFTASELMKDRMILGPIALPASFWISKITYLHIEIHKDATNHILKQTEGPVEEDWI